MSKFTVGRRLLRFSAKALAALASAVIALILLYAVAPPVSTLMLGRWLLFRPVDRQWVSLERIAPVLPAAVIMSEDGRFCRHHGVDWDALREVLDDEGGPSRGASTLTMQVAKNLFLWPSRSVLRKGIEIPLALVIDAVWSKKRIVEVYLNIAEWGEGVFGAEAAARRHFGKSAATLSAREAALLAAALPNPGLRDAGRPSRRHQGLAGLVQTRMRSAGPWLDCLD